MRLIVAQRAAQTMRRLYRQNTMMVLVIGLFVAGGIVFAFSSRAAGPFIAAEVESGVLSGLASSVSDSGASGGSAVKFGSGGSTGGYKYISAISANKRYFVDQNGDPILVKSDAPWPIPTRLSPSEVELWAANRESHGYNAAIISAIGHTTNGGYSNSGSTYDGILPYLNNNITQFNEPYWARMDSYMTIMKNHGITVLLYPMDGWTTLSDGIHHGRSNADCFTYGQKIAQRYNKTAYPNIIWMTGGDYNGYDTAINNEFKNMLDGIRSTGDTRPFSIQLNSETNSTDVDFWEPYAQWNFVYTYEPTYPNVWRAYNRPAGARDPRPSMFGEGNYEFEDYNGAPGTTNETLRRQQLWALTSGSPGEVAGTSDWQFLDNWQSRLNTPSITELQKNRAFFESLKWYELVPDTAGTLVTAGRGTKQTSASGDVLNNDYVTAAQTPDKSQTIIYIPTNTGNTNARTITVDRSKLPSGFTATWVDPTNATSTQAATIDGSGNTTTPGTHSDGKRDWLLLIK